MHQGDGADETRRFQGSGSGTDATRRLAGPDATRRMADPGGLGGSSGPVLGGRYRLEGELGAGGMAEVHRGIDLRLNRPVAVKVFRPGADRDGGQRFQQEARTLADLSHPGLVAVLDFGVEQHRAYLVMELVDGWTLREWLGRQRLPVDQAARIGSGLADALASIHEQGVVHGDVTPSHVLFGRDGRALLADFGIIQLAGAAGLTAGGAPLGTVSYLAPEQVQGGQAGFPADVYALGLVVLEAVTGRLEYPGDSREAAAERLSTPPAVPDELPAPLRSALLAMIRTDPTRRPTAAQAAEMLADARADDAGREQPRRSRAPRNVAIALGAVALVAVLVGLVLAGDDEPGVAQPGATPTAIEEPAAGDAPGQDPAGEDPGGDAGEDSPGFPDPPRFDAPELPELPDVPEMPESSREDLESGWERFKNWVSSWF